MAHYHKGRNQQAKKWERFTRRYGMKPAEFRELKKIAPQDAQKLKEKAYAIFIKES